MKLYDGTDWKGTKVGEQGGYLRSYEAELDDFARAVMQGREPAAGAEYAVGELQLALAMYRSAETKQWEKVGQAQPGGPVIAGRRAGDRGPEGGAA